MKSISDMVKITDKEKNNLKDNFISKLKDNDFKELASSLDLKDEILMNYTSSLEEASHEIHNCKNCKGLHECKNKVCGYRYTPNIIKDKIDFSYDACKYQLKYDKDTQYQSNIYLFEVPKKLKEANLKELYTVKVGIETPTKSREIHFFRGGFYFEFFRMENFEILRGGL